LVIIFSVPTKGRFHKTSFHKTSFHKTSFHKMTIYEDLEANNIYIEDTIKASNIQYVNVGHGYTIEEFCIKYNNMYIKNS